MTAGLGVSYHLGFVIPHSTSPLIVKDLKHLYKRLIMFSWIYPMVFLFECTMFIRATRILRFIIESVSWFENDTENIDDKVSSILYNIHYIKIFLRKSKIRIGQHINVNDSYPVGILSKSSCKITTKDKQHFFSRKWLACNYVKWER